MTKDEIIEIARQATDNESIYCRQEFTFSEKQLQAFANFVVAKEREACAKIVEASPSYDWHKFACEAAYAIRARGEKT